MTFEAFQECSLMLILIKSLQELKYRRTPFFFIFINITINYVKIFFSLTIGTDESLLDKFNQHHANNTCYEMPPTRESVFSILHYAGRVKYQIEVSNQFYFLNLL